MLLCYCVNSLVHCLTTLIYTYAVAINRQCLKKQCAQDYDCTAYFVNSQCDQNRKECICNPYNSILDTFSQTCVINNGYNNGNNNNYYPNNNVNYPNNNNYGNGYYPPQPPPNNNYGNNYNPNNNYGNGYYYPPTNNNNNYGQSYYPNNYGYGNGAIGTITTTIRTIGTTIVMMIMIITSCLCKVGNIR